MADGQIPPVSTPYYDILSLENVHFTFKNNLKCLGVVQKYIWSRSGDQNDDIMAPMLMRRRETFFFKGQPQTTR